MFPRGLEWLNVAPLRMDKQRGRPVLVEFWDFCRANSLRTLPYLRAWHERYARRRPARDRRPRAGLRALARPGGGARGGASAWRSSTRSCIDTDLELWELYGNQGWPARYLLDRERRLFDYHYGEGAYQETERAIQELLGVEREPSRPCGPRTRPGASSRPDRRPAGRLLGPLRGRRGVGGARGRGDGAVNGARARGRRPGLPTCSSSTSATPPACSSSSSATGVTCHATCFTPGLAPASSSLGVRVAEQAQQPRRAVVLDHDARARPVRAAGPASRSVNSALVDPAAGVEQPRAAGRPPLGRSSAATGRCGGCGRRRHASAPTPSRPTTSPIAVQAGAAQRDARQLGRSGPSPARFSAAAAGRPNVPRATAASAAAPAVARRARARRGRMRRCARAAARLGRGSGRACRAARRSGRASAS